MVCKQAEEPHGTSPKAKSQPRLARFGFKARPSATRKSSVKRKSSVARRDSKRLGANGKRTSVASKRRSASTRPPSALLSSRGISPQPPPNAESLPMARPTATKNSSGGFLRRLTRHFTSKKSAGDSKTSSSRDGAEPKMSASKSAPPTLSIIVPPPDDKPNDQPPPLPSPASQPIKSALKRSPTQASRTPSIRSKSPVPSNTSKRSKSRPHSPVRESLASFRYPPLPPSPVPPLPSPDESPLLQMEEAISPSEVEERPRSDAISDSVVHDPLLQEVDTVLSPPPLLPSSPTLVHSDSADSPALATPISPVVETWGQDITGEGDVTRGRKATRAKEALSLLSVPGEEVPGLIPDDSTDEERGRSQSRDIAFSPSTEECSIEGGEQRKLTVLVPPSNPLLVGLGFSPTSIVVESPTIGTPLEKVEEKDEDVISSERKSDSSSVKSGGIEFVIPAQPEEKAGTPLDKPRARTASGPLLTPASNANRSVKRSSTFGKLLGIGKKGDRPVSLFSSSATETDIATTERRPSGDKLHRGLSLRASRLDIEASQLPRRAPTIRGVVTNRDITTQMDSLRTHGTMSALDHAGVSHPVDTETERLTEAVFF
ncbi:hypothetical protein FRB99_005840 [Tulasnella sp. 403]|nr:hypothetical protein FRB99_005840 [Tulasnella sp. 403]